MVTTNERNANVPRGTLAVSFFLFRKMHDNHRFRVEMLAQTCMDFMINRTEKRKRTFNLFMGKGEKVSNVGEKCIGDGNFMQNEIFRQIF